MRVNNALYKDYNNTLYELLTLQMFYDGYIYIYKWKVIISPPYLFFLFQIAAQDLEMEVCLLFFIFFVLTKKHQQ